MASTAEPQVPATPSRTTSGRAGLRAVGDVPEGPSRYINREISWLDFNARVLSQAAVEETPLLERAKFLAIFSQNLDEFFQVRVAGLSEQVEADVGVTDPAGLSAAEQLRAIRHKVEELIGIQSRVFLDEIRPALAEKGVRLCHWGDLDGTDRDYLLDVFEQRIFPVLTPLAVDPAHPFPYISNLSLNLAVIVQDPISGERRFARVKVPPLLPRFVRLPDGVRLVPLEQVIAAHLHLLFPGMEIACQFAFRVTRNADLTLEEEEAEDLLAAVEMELRRLRFGKAVRLEIDAGMSDEVRELLMRELDLEPSEVYAIEGPLDLGGLWAVHDLDRPDLKDEPWPSTTAPGLETADDQPVDIFALLREREVLVHHPYESFTTSTVAFIQQAAVDPHVLAIKQTLYRTSGDSPVVKALIRAAERGKQVAALVEVKARFDERANIAWARALEQAGVHVVYGIVGLKTHAKVSLVVRQEEDVVRRYFHLGTGNYNPKTARLYEDLGFLSSDAEMGADLAELFNFLTGYSRQTEFRKLVVAPTNVRKRVIELIEEEAAAPAGTGRIVMKLNSLADSRVIDALYAASQADVQIDLVVRGICGLRPGVPGLSDNIRVRSIVGRYLEHSRIFTFGGGPDRPTRFYVGSADMMPRNLDRRIEVVFPVTNASMCDRLQRILTINLADDTLSWTLGPDGTWTKVPTVDGVNTHVELRALAIERARRRREQDTLNLR